MEKPSVVHIASFSEIDWYLELGRERLVGRSSEGNREELYEFWPGSPPSPGAAYHELFVAVCELAVARKILRPIRMYTAVG